MFQNVAYSPTVFKTGLASLFLACNLILQLINNRHFLMIKQLMFIFNEEIVQSEHYSIQIYALCKLEMYKTKAKDFYLNFI